MPTTVDQYEGYITRVNARGFCFIGCVGFDDAFAHLNDMHDFDEFDSRLIGRRVTCSLRRTERGYVAENVRPAR